MIPETPQYKHPIAIAYGGGVNSTAMLCGLRERNITPAVILFADTGGETPETYSHLLEINTLCQLWWGIEIETVVKTYQGKFEGLEKNCLRKKMLPSLAYGRKACSMKYKVEPQTKRLKQWMDEKNQKSIIRCIGYDAGEAHRALSTEYEDMKKGRAAYYRYPLVEWQWRRQECLEAIKRHGLTPPQKSACFFCPATKRGEIINLKNKYPALFQRALDIESNAILQSPGRGLGGASMRWENVDAQDEAQGKLWDWLDEHDESPIPCGCFDG